MPGRRSLPVGLADLAGRRARAEDDGAVVGATLTGEDRCLIGPGVARIDIGLLAYLAVRSHEVVLGVPGRAGGGGADRAGDTGLIILGSRIGDA